MDLGNAPESARHSESSGTGCRSTTCPRRRCPDLDNLELRRTRSRRCSSRCCESLIKELLRFEEHDWSCVLKERLRQALIDQAQTGTTTTYKELADRLGPEPPLTI